MFHILVVEDDRKLRQLFCTVLEKNGYQPFGAENGEQALLVMEKEYIDLLISDIMMPGMDGYALTQTLRQAGYALPILLVTAKDDFPSMEQGFRLGSDDYMVKPIDVNEMVLRVGALLRRAQIINERKLEVGGTLLEWDSLTVLTAGEAWCLPQKEFYLLYKLLSYPNKIFTRQQLMDEIWGLDTESESRTVDVHINRLRERFRENADFEIVTIRGLGYKAVKRCG